MEVVTGKRSIVPHAVWICVELHGTTRVVAALVVPGRTGYHILLGRHWMHDTGIRGDYKLGTYTILGDDGTRSKLPRAGDRSVMSEPSSSSAKSPLWVTVNSADREDDTELDDEDSDGDVSEGCPATELDSLVVLLILMRLDPMFWLGFDSGSRLLTKLKVQETSHVHRYCVSSSVIQIEQVLESASG
ncbi:hypothetical protein N7451_009704 [Penicillium sp. IBT 35674x]|nr:hypothetical protein N7451_009704 [Penicillium sp. IBT 35674x]